jgi:hypothetical protein
MHPKMGTTTNKQITVKDSATFAITTTENLG